VGKETLVLRMNFCTENRQLRQAANRYASLYGDSATINICADIGRQKSNPSQN
jgi:hypothetical protein